MLASTEVREQMYEPGQSCATDIPFAVVKKPSKIQCAVPCLRAQCREYSFDDATKNYINSNILHHINCNVLHSVSKRLCNEPLKALCLFCRRTQNEGL